MRPALARLGELEVLEFHSTQPTAPLVICMHGYGADCYDLAELHNFLDPQKKANWIFPNGPLKVPIGPHMFGRGWFSIDIMGLQMAIHQGRVHEIEDYVPPELKSSTSKVRTIIEMKKKPLSDVILMGFSQGAMMATELALNLKENIRGLVLMSGALIDQKNWIQKMPQRKGMRFFQSHGGSDPVLPVEGARKLNALMTESQWEGGYHEFDGGHEIPLPVLQDIQSFLKSLL